MASISSLLILCIFIQLVSGYPQFQSYIPNGQRVSNPCIPDTVWMGVGHINPAGGGARNPFGLDFERSGYNWTAVCDLDSDGDGQTNGEELGDSNCTWVRGTASPEKIDITHPGVCEPMSLPACQNRNVWLTCPTSFNCPAINNPGVVEMPLRLPPTPVPPKETTYMCHAFKMPDDTNYHVIATTPILNNSAIIHHIILYMCDSWQGNETVFNESVECFMGGFNCISIVGLWGVGATGQCLLDTYGFLIGKDGFKYALLEVHWNNAQELDTYVDSSGLNLFYTPTLRPYNGAVLMSGQTSLEIPPGLSSYTYNMKCSEYCTSVLARSVNIPWVTLHMHGLGKSGHVDLYRNGTLLAVLLNSTRYDYNDPPTADFSAPFAFHPGDEIRVTCEFDTTSRNTTTRFGEGTSDEMCYAFLTYYPADPTFTFCSQHRSAEVCSNIGLNCDMDTFETLTNTVQSECSTYPNCSSSCEVAMQGIVDTGCLEGDIGLFLEDFVPTVAALRVLVTQCGVSMNTASTTAHTTPLPASPTTDSGTGSTAGLWLWTTATISTLSMVIVSLL